MNFLKLELEGGVDQVIVYNVDTYPREHTEYICTYILKIVF
jgi:hypothetical protein